MTSRPRRVSAAWLVAPLAAGSLAVSTEWALQHDPLQGTAQTSQQTVSPRLQRQTRVAAVRLQRSETALARLDASLHRHRLQLVRLNAYVQALREVRGLAPAAPLSGGHAASAPGTAPLPPPVAVPPLNTTTGAS